MRLFESTSWNGQTPGTDGVITLSDAAFQQTWVPAAVEGTSIDYNSSKEDFQVGLFRVHSPLLAESWLVSFPPLIDMLKFSGCSCLSSGRDNRVNIQERYRCTGLSPRFKGGQRSMLYRLFSWLFRVVGRQYKDPRNQQRIEHCDVARRTTTVKSSDIHAASTQLRSVQTDLADAYTLCFSRPNDRAYESTRCWDCQIHDSHHD